MQSTDLAGRRVVVVGGSRGIGARVAARAAELGGDVLLTFHKHEARAKRVVSDVRAAGGTADALQTDVTSAQDIARLCSAAQARLGEVDALVLSASGGLEEGAPPSYATEINSVAPSAVVSALLPALAPGGVVVFLTSHEAHCTRLLPPYQPYALIADSKRRGEAALVGMEGELRARGVRLNIVCADVVEDSYTGRLLERRDPGLLARRKSLVGRLPTSQEVADEVIRCLQTCELSGSVFYIWGLGPQYAAPEGEHAHVRPIPLIPEYGGLHEERL